MSPFPSRALIVGGVLFLVGVVLLLLWMEGRSGFFFAAGIGTVCVSVISLAVAGRLMAEKPDPLEQRHEQRLWRSGPLGRLWLSRRGRVDRGGKMDRRAKRAP
jgi:hypothetical protein